MSGRTVKYPWWTMTSWSGGSLGLAALDDPLPGIVSFGKNSGKLDVSSVVNHYGSNIGLAISSRASYDHIIRAKVKTAFFAFCFRATCLTEIMENGFY
jgi:hypothetical protein